MKRLENKIALVTGGNSGIGYAAAEALIAQGARVIITGRKKEAVEAAAKKIGAIGLIADQSDIESARQLAEDVENLYGKIDILILNAGISIFWAFIISFCHKGTRTQRNHEVECI